MPSALGRLCPAARGDMMNKSVIRRERAMQLTLEVPEQYLTDSEPAALARRIHLSDALVAEALRLVGES